MTSKSKLQCGVCGTFHETLGKYDDSDWWVCLDCFEKADAMAAKEDRWPGAIDFAVLKQRLCK